MNRQNFEDQTGPSDLVKETDEDTDNPVVNSDPYDAEEDSVLTAETEIEQTPVIDGSVAEVETLDETIIDETPVDEAVPSNTSVSETNAGSPATLLDPIESEHLHTRWSDIQGKFVDEPRAAVQQADALVSEVIKKITRKFANEHSALEGQWKEGNDVSTEDLRQVLQHYRSFFNRLVA